MYFLKVVEDVILKLANKIFTSKNIDIKESYKELTSLYFKSEVDQIDFSKNIEAAKTVNDWCSEKTNNKIKELIGPSKK